MDVPGSTIRKPPIVYLTAGAANMLCGSCLHDNTLVRALIRRGIDAQLVPTYTPIRTDEENVSSDRVFFGGLNVFLAQSIPGFRFLPSFATRLLDQPWLIRLATRRASAISAKTLGSLTVSMLRGTDGFQRREVEQLCDWLAESVKPSLVNFSNILIAGCLPALKRKLNVPVLVTLQGDDIFLEGLTEPYKSQSLSEIRRLVDLIDGFIVNSRYYASYMSDLLGIPAEKIHIVPLGVDVSGFPPPTGSAVANASATSSQASNIGFLARLAPEKGLHVLIDAFIELRRRPTNARLHIAGWLGAAHQAYVEEQRAKLAAAKLESEVHWAGELTRNEKIEFLRGLDLFSVPTTYREPKGLFVLEAMAAGIPVVQPNHGAFPEIIAATGGGRLVPPVDTMRLADELETLLNDAPTRHKLGQTGQQAVHARFNADAMAERTWEVMRLFV
jgi:glycosyltransferase involved in cell wall biosynthesis